jgi:large subunit ribosomal protein L30
VNESVNPVKAPTRAKKPRARKSEAAATVRLRLVKSGIATPVDQKATIRSLGFRRIGEVVERHDTPALRGRIRKIRHLLEILPAEN